MLRVSSNCWKYSSGIVVFVVVVVVVVVLLLLVLLQDHVVGLDGCERAQRASRRGCVAMEGYLGRSQNCLLGKEWQQ